MSEPEAPVAAASATPPEPTAAPEARAAQADEERELLWMFAVLVGLVIVAAVVFLVIPTEWIGARVEVIINK
jgi:hypothetical protein